MIEARYIVLLALLDEASDTAQNLAAGRERMQVDAALLDSATANLPTGPQTLLGARNDHQTSPLGEYEQETIYAGPAYIHFLVLT